MKSKINITLLILVCFMLMGCPGGHFYEYNYTGTEITDDELAFTKVEYEKDKFFNIRTGHYLQFIKPKQSGLSAIIELSPNFDLNKNIAIKNVKSSIFGKLEKVDSLSYPNRIFEKEQSLTYNLTFENNNEKRMLKKIENDTISIELLNGKTLQFVRKTTE